MGQLTITLPDELEAQIREYVAREHYGSVSDFVRDSVRDHLRDNPAFWQRLQVVLELENNKLLSGKHWHHEELLASLRSGFKSEYANENGLISRDELSEDRAQFIFDVLDMFAQLQLAAKASGDAELEKGYCLRDLMRMVI